MIARRNFPCIAALLMLACFGKYARTQQAQQPAAESPKVLHPFASNEEAEQFLHSAEIVASKWTGEGITNPRRITLDDGKTRHDAIFKIIDVRKFGVTKMVIGAEVDFKDSWKFEVAAYELDKILSLGMVPPTVERYVFGTQGSLQLWLDNCTSEAHRLKNNLQPPNAALWNEQMYKVRIFDNLIYNIDRNATNLLISPDWKIYMIDHSRTFKSVDALKSPKDLTHFSPSMIEALRKLDEKVVAEKIGKYLNPGEISNLIKRRDLIIKLYEKMREQKGTVKSFFNRMPGV